MLTVVHDLTLAARYADRLIWMKDGRIVADGTVHNTLKEGRLRDVFGIAARISQSDASLAIHIAGPA
ncbi:hypothetical protein RM533_07050 [Croceicoccus sp. F390]|uniref:Uncharacterized protein n=1 Tax=Croceicoccus esteveae TaxID=3075597 RepID=A0ABU2ZHS8_9SPHN|nr:hypothetical protein [Croceicoccus sp. F390]MDT0575940.1 hypothetical protein [Croceicoccus sp. F390]